MFWNLLCSQVRVIIEFCQTLSRQNFRKIVNVETWLIDVLNIELDYYKLLCELSEQYFQIFIQVSSNSHMNTIVAKHLKGEYCLNIYIEK